MPLIYHTRKGAGSPPLVFVHGFGCARSDWDDQVAQFSAKHETVAVDLGGHGTTPGTAAHGRIETHGADVAHLMTELNLGPSVIFGHSMGCRIAMEAAARVPERAKALVLVDGSRLGEAGARSWEGRAKTLKELGYAKFVSSAFAQMFGPDYDKAKAQAIIKRAVDRDPDIAGPLFVDIGRYDSENMDRMLAGVKVPMLVIQSTVTHADGRRVGLQKGETTPYLDQVRAKVKGARIEIVPGIGHFPQLERVPETNALIADFIKDLK